MKVLSAYNFWIGGVSLGVYLFDPHHPTVNLVLAILCPIVGAL